MSTKPNDTDDEQAEQYSRPTEMAEALLEVEENDTIKATMIIDGDQCTTKQKVVDVAEKGSLTVIYCEEAPGWNGPSVSFEILDVHGRPDLRNELKHPMQDPTSVDGFASIELSDTSTEQDE